MLCRRSTACIAARFFSLVLNSDMGALALPLGVAACLDIDCLEWTVQLWLRISGYTCTCRPHIMCGLHAAVGTIGAGPGGDGACAADVCSGAALLQLLMLSHRQFATEPHMKARHPSEASQPGPGVAGVPGA